ncbi:GOLPH3/VPS74 family protein [Pseudonocardia humida]|uniref:GPP34 family phosphoprotein n=1 Tax=Pseudonocardia humida TaxID=2800819 RepID=A0ABT1A3C7_9PSEU|nr:GPP34 family phosphoprotein [Pseudonocardia humida]MCO1657495.1 GPP34 family phosphoprotein [Pseudonocardia humida]
MTTLAEDLVLLLVDPASGRLLAASSTLDRGLAGALLLDLALRERLAVEGRGRRVLISVVDPGATGEPVVDVALVELGRTPLRARDAVERLAGRVRGPVFERLTERGLLAPRRGRRWGLFPTAAWDVLGGRERERLLAGVERVLLHDQPSDVRLSCLISLLHAVRAEHRVVEGPVRRVRARAAEIAGDELLGTTGRGQVAAIRSAVLPSHPRSTGADAQWRPPSFS